MRRSICELRDAGLIESLVGPQEREGESFGPFVGKPRYAITEAGLRRWAEWISGIVDLDVAVG